MHISTLPDLERGYESPSQLALWGDVFSFSSESQCFAGRSWDILCLQWFFIQKVEKSFSIGGKIYHKVQFARWSSNHTLEEVAYRLKEWQSYVIDEQGSFVSVPGRYNTQKITDIVGRIPLFWGEYYLCSTHTGQTYIVDSSLQIQKDSLRRDVRNVFKMVKVEGMELIFCEVWEYGEWITHTVLKRGFAPVRTTDGKEVVRVKKFELEGEKIILECENEDGKVGKVQIQK